LFSLKRPPGIGKHSTVQEIFQAYADPRLRSEELYKQNVSAMRELFATRLRLGFPANDLIGIEDIYEEFYTAGMDIHYEITPGSNGSFPTYADLMQATDESAVARSFLASEENFAAVKDLQRRNLVVPVVGNFAGPTAIRAIGKYLRAHQATVAAFYVSNVEQYLERDGGRERFCASVATLPLDEWSIYIRSERGGFGTRGFRRPGGFSGFAGNFSSLLKNMRQDLKECTSFVR
jgi:hypothetical protein